jgi:hypothetical protein
MIRATGEIESVCPRPLTRWVKKVSGPVSLDFCTGTIRKVFSVPWLRLDAVVESCGGYKGGVVGILCGNFPTIA